MNTPKIKVFINRGCLEAVYADTSLLDIEIIECTKDGSVKRFDEEYDAAEASGLSEITVRKKTINLPWYDKGEEIEIA